MVALVVAMVSIPLVRHSLQTTPLDATQLALVGGGALVGGAWLEGLKLVSGGQTT